MKPNTTSTRFDPAAALAAAPEVSVPDEDNPPTAPADWHRAMVTSGGGVAATLTELRRHRGLQQTPTKVLTALRLSPEVIAFFKATGRGWQMRVDDALKEYVQTHSDRL